ncbi:MAG: hypothetical protein K1000chlam2_00580 [Chlamydiae bacterium]|nr:hypothetical protein [Chlamydiota bacterium]
MIVKTQGKCFGCGEKYTPVKGRTHLLKCTDVLQSLRSDAELSEGYLIRVSWAELPDAYWMLIGVPKNLSLYILDEFLRDTWLECCGHLSMFIIHKRFYASYPEPDSDDMSMEKQISQIVSVGLKFDYVYDMGSSTDLKLKILGTIEACPQEKVTLLMQNDPPLLPCKSCKKEAHIICSLCGETTCQNCSERHSCAVQEKDTYMLMPLVNSPRAGICGYEGSSRS